MTASPSQTASARETVRRAWGVAGASAPLATDAGRTREPGRRQWPRRLVTGHGPGDQPEDPVHGTGHQARQPAPGFARHYDGSDHADYRAEHEQRSGRRRDITCRHRSCHQLSLVNILHSRVSVSRGVYSAGVAAVWACSRPVGLLQFNLAQAPSGRVVLGQPPGSGLFRIRQPQVDAVLAQQPAERGVLALLLPL